MLVVDLANFAQKILEIVLLGKTGELRSVVEAGIESAFEPLTF